MREKRKRLGKASVALTLHLTEVRGRLEQKLTVLRVNTNGKNATSSKLKLATVNNSERIGKTDIAYRCEFKSKFNVLLFTNVYTPVLRKRYADNVRGVIVSNH